MFASQKLVSVIAVLSLAQYGAAFNKFGNRGGPCTPGESCQFVYAELGGLTGTIEATCAPNGICGDPGAACDCHSQCYDYCGHNGICGGKGAPCNLNTLEAGGNGGLGSIGSIIGGVFGQVNDGLDLHGVGCYSPGYVCATNPIPILNSVLPGCCVPGSSQAGKSKNHHRRLAARMQANVQSRCGGLATACAVPGGGFECLDTQSSLDSCGGCPGGRLTRDCSAIPNAMGVSCQRGVCVVDSCEDGYKAVGDECVLE